MPSSENELKKKKYPSTSPTSPSGASRQIRDTAHQIWALLAESKPRPPDLRPRSSGLGAPRLIRATAAGSTCRCHHVMAGRRPHRRGANGHQCQGVSGHRRRGHKRPSIIEIHGPPSRRRRQEREVLHEWGLGRADSTGWEENE